MTIPKLYHKDGREAAIGDSVTDFRGGTAVISGWPANGGHKHLGGRNRVWVREGGELYEHEYYPSVFDLSWDKPNTGEAS